MERTREGRTVEEKRWGGNEGEGKKPWFLRWGVVEEGRRKRWEIGEGGGGGWGAGRREWLRDKSGASGCERVCVMSGWPRGAVDSLCCSADVLTGSRPFAHSLAPPLTAKRTGVAEGDAGETGEVEGWVRRQESGKQGNTLWTGIKNGRAQSSRQGTDLTL